MLISEEYRALNAQLHKDRPDYGRLGHKWSQHIRHIAKQFNVVTVLDYGCGKQTLSEAMPAYFVHNYDPAIPGLDEPPPPSDLVVCTDVLEHIEPDCLDDVLNDLREKTKVACFLVVNCIPASKTLADGRNAHLIQQDYHWWLPRLWDRWRMVGYTGRIEPSRTIEFVFVGTP